MTAYEPPPPSVPPAEHQSIPASAPARILVVDDDPTIRRINADILGRYGFQVDKAEDGLEAWELLQRQKYDLMVTDNNMPRLTGVELIQKIHTAGLSFPVIMVTGLIPSEEIMQTLPLKPVAILLKPYTLANFSATVTEVLRTTGRTACP